MKKYKCLCCGCRTLDARGEYDICPVCFWEDERDPYRGKAERESEEYTGEDVLDRTSGANHGLTLRQGRANYRAFGACEKEMLPHVRPPRQCEMEGEEEIKKTTS